MARGVPDAFLRLRNLKSMSSRQPVNQLGSRPAANHAEKGKRVQRFSMTSLYRNVASRRKKLAKKAINVGGITVLK